MYVNPFAFYTTYNTIAQNCVLIKFKSNASNQPLLLKFASEDTISYLTEQSTNY